MAQNDFRKWLPGYNKSFAFVHKVGPKIEIYLSNCLYLWKGGTSIRSSPPSPVDDLPAVAAPIAIEKYKEQSRE